jgi:hypothetical protein
MNVKSLKFITFGAMKKEFNIDYSKLTKLYYSIGEVAVLFQVNASPIHQKCALIMAKILDDPKNWNQLMSLYHSYEAYLD